MHAQIMVVSAEGKPSRTLGKKEFPQLPRIGEALVINSAEEGEGSLFRVVDIHYDGHDPSLCDVWIQYEAWHLDSPLLRKQAEQAEVLEFLKARVQ